ncbi:MAG TPA: DUF892 family protein [Alphaproteobacteria bacterium]|nr:DUF892 family protein [Alphaproteobacteria bacterium]
MVEWAKELGYDESIPLLEKNLQEEKNADKKLTEIALDFANKQAA